MCYARVHVHDYINVYINLCACHRCHVLHTRPINMHPGNEKFHLNA